MDLGDEILSRGRMRSGSRQLANNQEANNQEAAHQEAIKAYYDRKRREHYPLWVNHLNDKISNCRKQGAHREPWKSIAGDARKALKQVNREYWEIGL